MLGLELGLPSGGLHSASGCPRLWPEHLNPPPPEPDRPFCLSSFRQSCARFLAFFQGALGALVGCSRLLWRLSPHCSLVELLGLGGGHAQSCPLSLGGLREARSQS